MGCHSSKFNTTTCLSQNDKSPTTPKHSTKKKSFINPKRRVAPVGSPGKDRAESEKVTIHVQSGTTEKQKAPAREVDLSAIMDTSAKVSHQSRDQNKKRVSMPQVENHIRHIVRQVADDDYFDEDVGEEENIMYKHSSQNATTSTQQNNVAQLDWNQVINEVMGSELSPAMGKKVMQGPHSSTKSVSNATAAAGKSLPHTDVYTRSATHASTLSPGFASKEQDSSLLDDEFDFSESEDDITKRSLNLSGILSEFKRGSVTNSPAQWKSSVQQVTVSFTCDLSHCTEKTEGVHLPLPLKSDSQKYVRYHSFEPRPLYEEIRKVGAGAYEVLFCQFEPDVTQVKYSVDLEVELPDPATLSSTPLYVGNKTPIVLVNGHNERIQDIIRHQKWMNISSVEERIRSIAEFVGQLPYHLDLYDQIYYYLDSNQPHNKSGLNAVFSLLCEAAGIEGDVDHSYLTGYIFPNLRENLFVKMCFRELIKVEILNKSQDNEFEKFYL